MKLVFFGKGDRAVACLRRLLERDARISLAVTHPGTEGKPTALTALAEEAGIPVIAPEDPNDPETLAALAAQQANLFVLAGYGKIVGAGLLAIPPRGAINLHAGALPAFRGSSPLNWALITGQDRFGLSILMVDSGVDTGPVLLQRDFPIGPDDTIADLHQTANQAFPEMLAEALDGLADGSLTPAPQPPDAGAYYPLRFPEDGLILWDMLTALQVHDRVRALTEPYPCATALFEGRTVRLLETRMTKTPCYGEPGRIYRKSKGKLLICAADRCLWVLRAIFEDDGTALHDAAARYARLGTVSEAARQILMKDRQA
jgi:methionyl-tRNA formyltransferase